MKSKLEINIKKVRELAEIKTVKEIANEMGRSYTVTLRFLESKGIIPVKKYTITKNVIESRVRNAKRRTKSKELVKPMLKIESNIECFIEELKKEHKDNILCKSWV